MKNYFQIPLFAIAVVIVLMVVGDSMAQSNYRGSSTRSSTQGGSSVRRSFPARGGGSSSKGSGGSRPNGLGGPRLGLGGGSMSGLGGSMSGLGGSSSTRGTRSRRSSSRSPQNREALDVQESEDPISPEAEKALQELNDIQTRLIDNRKQIDQLFRDMPIGFDNAQMQKQKQIDLAKEKAKALELEKIEKGIEVFRLAPMRQKTSIDIVLKKLIESLSPSTPSSNFDPKTAMEISKLLLDQEVAQLPPRMLLKAFYASYAVHDFEQASLILDRLEEFGPVKDVYYEVLEETNQAWQDELAIRRLETATGDLPYAVVETTEGKFIIELFENQATLTVYDFVSRAESGFYDGLPFHWVRPGEFARVGWSRQTRGPANDTISSEAQNEKGRKHFAGSVSMISADGQTTSSVFQICHQPKVELNGKHTVFGRVVDFKETVEGKTAAKEALDVVYSIKTIDANRMSSSPTEPSKIIKITIENKRSHGYKSTETADSSNSPSGGSNPLIQAGNNGESSSSFDLLPQGGPQN